MKILPFRTHSSLLLTTALILLCGSSFVLWAYTLAEGPLKIQGPKVISKKETVKVTDPATADRKFDPKKFTKKAEPPIVTVDLPSTDDGNFVLTPVKSGKAKLSIEYVVDESTTLKGTFDIVVPYKEHEIKGTGEEPFKLVMGQNASFDVFGTDVDGTVIKLTEAEATSANPTIATASFSNGQLQLEPKSVGSTEVRLGVLGMQTEPITVEVTGITKIEVNDRGVVGSREIQIVIPESETRQLTVRILGAKGTEFKRTDIPTLQTRLSGGDPCGINVQAAYAENDANVLTIATPALIGGCTRGTRTITLEIPKGPLAKETVSTTINVVITQKIGFIKLTTSNPLLSQNSRITITAEVFGTNNIAISPSPDVKFALKDPEKNGVWVSLVKEGNKATLVSRNPTQAEIREKNDNELVPRPSEVVVIAKAKPDPASPEIESSIIIGLGEVVGFDLLKVKLNLMDERTASDLYGKVTSDEYYVLTVRLFNNLENERTGGNRGNSILAYSSSIEVAVQLEKKFDRKGSNSYFPRIISKAEAENLVDNTTRKTAIENAQEELKDALDEQYSTRKDAITKVNDAVEKKARAEKLTVLFRSLTDPDARREAFDAANVAISEYNLAWADAHAALAKATAAEDVVISIRAQVVRDTLNRAADTQAFVTDPDTAIDDGKWHPMSPVDLIRLSPASVPKPTIPRPDDRHLPMLTEADFDSRPRRAAAPRATEEPAPEEETDPPCRGVITYRPFTFEMMVNTVDRRDGRSIRSRVFKALDLIGTGTSFITAVAVPGPSSDLPLGLEKYGNLLLPGLDKLYPNYKEQQRQNIVSQAMKEIEEIPFGSDITRVIFIPKRNIRGLVRGHDVRISEVCPFFFRIQVAIVSKNATVEQGVIR
jgi:hypothetical protein